MSSDSGFRIDNHDVGRYLFLGGVEDRRYVKVERDDVVTLRTPQGRLESYSMRVFGFLDEEVVVYVASAQYRDFNRLLMTYLREGPRDSEQ